MKLPNELLGKGWLPWLEHAMYNYTRYLDMREMVDPKYHKLIALTLSCAKWIAIVYHDDDENYPDQDSICACCAHAKHCCSMCFARNICSFGCKREFPDDVVLQNLLEMYTREYQRLFGYGRYVLDVSTKQFGFVAAESAEFLQRNVLPGV